jgi:hypothetical protein
MMIHIESEQLSIDAIMRSREETLTGEPTPDNYPTLGTWGKSRTPFRVFLHEPTDSLKPSTWVLELAARFYPLRRHSELKQNEVSKTWEDTAPTWRIRTADGRWVPHLQSLDDEEVTID